MQYPIGSYIIAFIFPCICVVDVAVLSNRRPSPENKLIGFRTVRSMSSPAAWKRAQYLFGRQLLIGAIVAALFGYGFLTVSSVFLKVVLIILQLVAVTFFGMFTEFILRKELRR